MIEVYGVGYFTVENEDGGEDRYAVTTCDDGTFCEVRSGDEDGDVVVSDYIKAVARFGIDFQLACDDAKEDWQEKYDEAKAKAIEARAREEARFDSHLPRRAHDYSMPKDPDHDNLDDR